MTTLDGNATTLGQLAHGAALVDGARGDVSAAGQVRRQRPDPTPLYVELTKSADENGDAGDIQWSFEKLLLAAGRNDRTAIPPAHGGGRPEVIAANEEVLPR